MDEDGLWRTPPRAPLPAALRPFVRTVSGYAADGLPPGVHRGLPGRALTFVLAIDAPLGVATSAGDLATGRVRHRHATLSGLHLEPAFVVQPGRWSGVQVDVSPLGARRLFDAPAAALAGDSFDAADVAGPALEDLPERLAAARSWSARYAVVVGWLLHRLSVTEPGRVRREVVAAWLELERSSGRVRVPDLAERAGLGSRRLAQLFRTELGVTPKAAARLVRFDAARRDVTAAGRAGPHLDLSGLAVRHGYFDHAHLVREFREFTGLSPTAWLAAEVGNLQAAEPPGAAGSTA